MDSSYSVTSTSRFKFKPKLGYWKMIIRIIGYLKKYPAKGFTIDPRNPIVEGDYRKLPVDFGNQHAEFNEDIDPRCPKQLMPEIETSIMADSDHAHDLATVNQ